MAQKQSQKQYFVKYQWYRPGGNSIFLCGFFTIDFSVVGNYGIDKLTKFLNSYFKTTLQPGETIYVMDYEEV